MDMPTADEVRAEVEAFLDANDDPEVFANDVIVVGDSPGRRLFKDILATTPLLVLALVGVNRHLAGGWPARATLPRSSRLSTSRSSTSR